MVSTDYIQKIRWSEKRIERTYKYNSVFTLTNNRKKKIFFLFFLSGCTNYREKTFYSLKIVLTFWAIIEKMYTSFLFFFFFWKFKTLSSRVTNQRREQNTITIVIARTKVS